MCMHSVSAPLESRKLALLCAIFILLFFLLFSYPAIFAYFTFDDGTAVVDNQQHFEAPMWRNFLHILTVFTTAYRPLATVFWRPLYAMFGYNPLPYRVAVHLMLIVNIGLAYILARRFEVTREAAALMALVFCFNASMSEMYYDTCIVTDPLCLLFYFIALIVYIHGRQSGDPLTPRRMVVVMVSYCLALDSKELAVAIPGIVTIYELFYRRQDYRDPRKARWIAGFIAAMFVVGAIYLKVKVPEMGQTEAYYPHATVGFIVKNIGLYMGQLLYRPDTSFTPLNALLILSAMIAAGLLVRSRAAVVGVLFFVTALIPVAAIPHRGAYCAYIPYFGLALTAGAVAADARSILTRRIKHPRLQTRMAVGLFLFAAGLLAWGHATQWGRRMGYFEWSKPQVEGLYQNFQRTIPEFPPNARVLIADDPWGLDWGQMFLVEMLYHDKTIWVDRPKTMERPPDPSSYDLVVSYTAPYVDLKPSHLFGIRMKWMIRGSSNDWGKFVYSSPAAHGESCRVEFEPHAVRGRESTVVKVPGLSNVPVNVLYRIVSGQQSTRRLVTNWCTLDAKGSCRIIAPPAENFGAMVIDWIQTPNQRWIFTSGVLTIVP